MYTVTFGSYCGMSGIPHEFGSEAEARDYAARRILARRRRGEIVTVLERGHEWEFETPDDAASISDDDGVLYLCHQPEPACDWCGSETEDGARFCSEECAESYFG